MKKLLFIVTFFSFSILNNVMAKDDSEIACQGKKKGQNCSYTRKDILVGKVKKTYFFTGHCDNFDEPKTPLCCGCDMTGVVQHEVIKKK